MMKQIFLFIAIATGCAFFSSCSEDHSAAKQRLTNARLYLAEQEFAKAKAEIDSISKLHPKSFEQRKVGLVLLDSIRKAENNFIIEETDKKLEDLLPTIEKLKEGFVFQKDEKYQETGAYVPKATAGSGVLSYTTLHSGVEEDGRVYLESIYIGAQKHNKLRVTAGNQSAETLIIEGDGFVHRFTDLGKSYEVIRIIGEYENGVAKFIAENKSADLKAHLSGQHNTSYTLPKNVKDAIFKSYELSAHMLLADSLRAVKEQAQFKNFYLENNKQLEVPIDSLAPNSNQ